MSVVSDDIEPLTFVFEDDGLVPNNPLPFLVYKQARSTSTTRTLKKPSRDCSAPMAGARCGATACSITCTTTRPCMKRSASRAAMRGCGSAAIEGKEIEIAAGDVAILPAGTGHQCISHSRDFCVVGAYPPGPKMHVTLPTPENHAKALKTIPAVKLPKTDPVLGEDGPLVRLWK